MKIQPHEPLTEFWSSLSRLATDALRDREDKNWTHDPRELPVSANLRNISEHGRAKIHPHLTRARQPGSAYFLIPSICLIFIFLSLSSLSTVVKLWKTSPTFHLRDHQEQIVATPVHFRPPCRVWALVRLSTKLKTRYQDPKQLPSHPAWSHQRLTPGLQALSHPLSREVSLSSNAVRR